MRIIAISDTHNMYNKLNIPECDILISCGDYSNRGEYEEIVKFHNWLNKQPARYKISVQGNHELGVEANFKLAKETALSLCPNVYFVSHELVEIEGIKIFCSGWTPYFFNWAYNGARNHFEAMEYNKPLMKDLWNDIPLDTNILVTHGPPYEILDELHTIAGTPKGIFVGCQDLANKVKEVKPDLHFFGHIHSSHGEKHIDGTSFYNVAICDEMYSPSNPIRIVDYDKS